MTTWRKRHRHMHYDGSHTQNTHKYMINTVIRTTDSPVSCVFNMKRQSKLSLIQRNLPPLYTWAGSMNCGGSEYGMGARTTRASLQKQSYSLPTLPAFPIITTTASDTPPLSSYYHVSRFPSTATRMSSNIFTSINPVLKIHQTYAYRSCLFSRIPEI